MPIEMGLLTFAYKALLEYSPVLRDCIRDFLCKAPMPRHPRLLGVRTDKDAREVVKE